MNEKRIEEFIDSRVKHEPGHSCDVGELEQIEDRLERHERLMASLMAELTDEALARVLASWGEYS